MPFLVRKAGDHNLRKLYHCARPPDDLIILVPFGINFGHSAWCYPLSTQIHCDPARLPFVYKAMK